MSLIVPLPMPPDWRIDWSSLLERYPIVATLKGVPQDSYHHGEGDVYKHTQLVCEALVHSSKWQDFSSLEREVVFLSALLHDIGKAYTTKEDIDGRLTSRGHSLKGARIVRRLLWETEVPFDVREQVVNLIRYHQVPYWIFERDTPQRLARQISLNVRCDHLAALSTADALGRKSEDRDRLIENIGLFEELSRSLDCLDKPAQFASDHGRFLYFRERWSLPEHAPFEDFKCHVVVMSGLPGAGKDHFLVRDYSHLPVVSLDKIRCDLDVVPSKNQGKIVQAAREKAREYLRSGVSFAWNATNVSLGMRRQIVDLMANYKAKVEIIYVETDKQRLFEQNVNRPNVVPKKVIDDLINHRWDVPDPWETDNVRYIVG